MTDRSAIFVCAGLYFIGSIVSVGPSYMFDDTLGYAPCINTQSFLSDYFNLYNKNLDLSISILALFLYCSLILFIRLRIKAAQAVASESEAAKMSLRRQLKLMPMFRNIVLTHIVFTFMAKSLFGLAALMPDYAQQRCIFIGAIFSCLDLFLNVISLLRNSDIREAAMWWRNNQVNPV